MSSARRMTTHNWVKHGRVVAVCLVTHGLLERHSTIDFDDFVPRQVLSLLVCSSLALITRCLFAARVLREHDARFSDEAHRRRHDVDEPLTEGSLLLGFLDLELEELFEEVEHLREEAA